MRFLDVTLLLVAPDSAATLPDSTRRLSSRGTRNVRLAIIVHTDCEETLTTVTDAIRREAARNNHTISRAEDTLQCSDAHLVAYISNTSHKHDAVLVFSDRFTKDADSGLAHRVREASHSDKVITVLAALTDADLSRVRLVDLSISPSAGTISVQQSVSRALTAILYKTAPPKHELAASDAVQIHHVADDLTFTHCLRLRYRAYSQLGYVDTAKHNVDPDLELDYYDPSAIHFAAIYLGPAPKDTVGTARLILSSKRHRRGGLFEDTASVCRHSHTMCERVVARSPQLAEKVATSPAAAALPLLAAFDFRDLTGDPKVRVGDICEVSRVVVAQSYRGLGVSRLLVRACIAAALELRLRFIVLECSPHHLQLYKRLGFSHVPVPPRTAFGINQLAVPMKLALDDYPGNIAVQIAKRDVAMMQESRCPPAPGPHPLCLCRDATCWRRGEYNRKGDSQCPLRPHFQPRSFDGPTT